MSEYYIEMDRRKVISALEKIGLELWEGKNHTNAKCITNGRKTLIPRHNTIKNKEMDNIGKFLLNKYQQEKVQELLK